MKAKIFGVLLYLALGIYCSWSSYDLALNKYYIEATIIGILSGLWFVLAIFKIIEMRIKNDKVNN